MQTAAALTVQAMMAVPSSAAGATSAPGPETPSPTGSPSQTITATPTYSVPMLTVLQPTNCRAGPGEGYEIIVVYKAGKKLEIVGRSSRGDYWLVKSSESPTGTCWLWGEYVQVTGSHWAVSSVTPPPTSTSAPPRAPSIQEWTFSCSAGILTFSVTWKDQSTGETGYRVFRNGEQVAELPANSTTYTETYAYPADQDVQYYVQVYSPAGSASSSVMKIQITAGACQ